MITKPTLFVLGAGASMPYGFPSGMELRHMICMLANGSSPINDLMSKAFSQEDIFNFSNAFKGSHISSIDSFLSKRPQYSAIGKYAIAMLLCRIENPGVLDTPPMGDDNWYFMLWNSLQAELHSIEDLTKNQIKIVTFNYDRSLESYLHTSIKNTFGLNDEAALAVLYKFSILHVYGSLGKFGLETHNEHRSFLPDTEPANVRIAASQLRVIPEAREDDVVFKTAQGWFYEAERVCFLGFGFDDLNVNRLNFAHILTHKHQGPSSVLVASTYGMTEAEIAIARSLIIGPNASNYSWGTTNSRNLQTLRNHAWLLR